MDRFLIENKIVESEICHPYHPLSPQLYAFLFLFTCLIYLSYSLAYKSHTQMGTLIFKAVLEILPKSHEETRKTFEKRIYYSRCDGSPESLVY